MRTRPGHHLRHGRHHDRPRCPGTPRAGSNVRAPAWPRAIEVDLMRRTTGATAPSASASCSAPGAATRKPTPGDPREGSHLPRAVRRCSPRWRFSRPSRRRHARGLGRWRWAPAGDQHNIALRVHRTCRWSRRMAVVGGDEGLPGKPEPHLPGGRRIASIPRTASCSRTPFGIEPRAARHAPWRCAPATGRRTRRPACAGRASRFTTPELLNTDFLETLHANSG